MQESEPMNFSTRALLDRARRYCAMAEQCESGVRQKLIAWGCGSTEAEPIMAQLREEGYIDDMRYARAYSESKVYGQHWGRQKVVYQMRSKRLPKEAIDEAMAAIDEGRYDAMLEEVATRKAHELGGISDERGRHKLMAFLASRGFTLSEINSITKKISKQ